MTVYVDDMQAAFRGAAMCHMIADSEDELHDMAAAIGMERRWYQGDHYDIILELRALAVALGAVEISWEVCGCMMLLRRRTGRIVRPETAIADALALQQADLAAEADRVLGASFYWK